MGCSGYFGPGRPELRMPRLDGGDEELKRGEIREVKLLNPTKDEEGGETAGDKTVKSVVEGVLGRMGL